MKTNLSLLLFIGLICNQLCAQTKCIGVSSGVVLSKNIPYKAQKTSIGRNYSLIYLSEKNKSIIVETRFEYLSIINHIFVNYNAGLAGVDKVTLTRNCVALPFLLGFKMGNKIKFEALFGLHSSVNYSYVYSSAISNRGYILEATGSNFDIKFSPEIKFGISEKLGKRIILKQNINGIIQATSLRKIMGGLMGNKNGFNTSDMFLNSNLTLGVFYCFAN